MKLRKKQRVDASEINVTGVVQFADICVVSVVDMPVPATLRLSYDGECAEKSAELSRLVPEVLDQQLVLAMLGLLPMQSGDIIYWASGIPEAPHSLVIVLEDRAGSVTRQSITPHVVPCIMATPVGCCISVWSTKGDRPSLLLGTSVLPQADERSDEKSLPAKSSDESTRPRTYFRSRHVLSADAFDGKIRELHLRSEISGSIVQSMRWQCRSEHDQTGMGSYLDGRQIANSLPPQEIDQIAHFLKLQQQVRPRFWEGLQPVDACLDPKIFIIAHSLTGAGALATETLHLVTEFLGGACTPVALLPSAEAAQFAAEVGAGCALTQQATIVVLPDLQRFIATIPDESLIVLVPGGTTLTQSGREMVRCPDGESHIGLPVTTLLGDGWTLNMHPVAPTLDIFQACAVLPRAKIGASLKFSESRHDDAVILGCTLEGLDNAAIASTTLDVRGLAGPRRSFRLIIDAQGLENQSAFEECLPALAALCPDCVVVGSRKLLLRLKELPAAQGIQRIMSLGMPLGMDDPAITAAMSPKPALSVTAEEAHALSLLPALQFNKIAAFALRETQTTAAGVLEVMMPSGTLKIRLLSLNVS